jgi:hypothetical protein
MQTVKDNTYLLVFHTEGEPHDRGFDLTSCAIEIKEKLGQYFKDIFIFTPRSLKELPGSDDFCNSWPEPLDQNPNANHVGYFDFKSFLIDYVLQRIPEGSVLMYHDGNFKRNPQYWESDWHIMPQMLEQLLLRNNTDLFVQLEQSDVKVKWHVKGHVLETFFPDLIERDLVANSCLIGAARIILRNTKFARSFIEDYKKSCLRKDLVSKTPLGNCYPEFKWSCGDQDVLNALVYKYILDGKFPSSFPDLIFMYRVMTFSNRTFTWKFDGPKEDWHDRPHPTGTQTIKNIDLTNYITSKG